MPRRKKSIDNRQSSKGHQLPLGAGAGLMTGFVNLTVEIIRENDGIFFFGGPGRPLPDLDEIGAGRNVRTVLLQDADR